MNIGVVQGKMQDDVVSLVARRSFADPPETVLPLCSSDVNRTHSTHQKYIVSKLVAGSSPQITCTFDRYARLKPIKELLSSTCITEASNFIAIFKNNACQFKAFRSVFIESLLNSEKEIAKEFNNMNILKFSEASFLQKLKELSITCQEICKDFIKTKPTLEDYGKFWDTYSRVIIELEFCFEPLADALNTVSAALCERQDFSICRLMKTIFINDCYYPLELKLKEEFVSKLKELVEHVIYSKDKLMTVQVVNEIHRMYLSIQGLIDMIVTETNVHYINTREYLDKIEDLVRIKEVRAQLTDCFIEFCQEIKAKELGNEPTDKLLDLYEKLFPISFLNQVNKHLQSIKTEELKQAIKNIELCEELKELISSVRTKLSIDPNEESGGVLEEVDSEVLRQFESLNQYESLLSFEESALIAKNVELGLILGSNTNNFYLCL
jgi:hypothetical protein